MAGRRARCATGLALAAVALAGARSSGADTSQAGAAAAATAVRVIVPSQPAAVAGDVDSASPSTTAPPTPFAYPADGSLVQVATVAARAAVKGMAARAASDLTHVSLLGGEITADAVVARSAATLASGSLSGGFGGTSVTNLVVLGQTVTPSPNLRVPLADWGHAILLEEETKPSAVDGPLSYRGWVTAVDVWLDRDHDGLPAGTRILLGYADASVKAPPAPTQTEAPPPPPPPPATTPKQEAAAPSATTPATQPQASASTDRPQREEQRPAKRPAKKTKKAAKREQGAAPPFPTLVVPPPSLHPKLTAGGYVFPVYGDVSYGDSFGAPRADVPGGWHHGDDIFAPYGAPVLAVADGTVFSVGPNRIGGNRLWLRDQQGNEFYYAHLSAYTPLARDGAFVHAGDVLGFVGNTGDAAGGPYHLHFEIHPASLVFLGYDGVVDPTRYLDAWRRLRDVRFPAGAAWALPLSGAATRRVTPGAILLQSSDISTASGLEPRSLVRAISEPAAGSEAATTNARRESSSRSR